MQVSLLRFHSGTQCSRDRMPSPPSETDAQKEGSEVSLGNFNQPLTAVFTLRSRCLKNPLPVRQNTRSCRRLGKTLVLRIQRRCCGLRGARLICRSRRSSFPSAQLVAPLALACIPRYLYVSATERAFTNSGESPILRNRHWLLDATESRGFQSFIRTCATKQISTTGLVAQGFEMVSHQLSILNTKICPP